MKRGIKRRANGTKRLAITNVFVPFARIYSAPDLSPRQRAWTIATEKQNDNIYSINARYKRRVLGPIAPSMLIYVRLILERFTWPNILSTLSLSLFINSIRRKLHVHLFDANINAWSRIAQVSRRMALAESRRLMTFVGVSKNRFSWGALRERDVFFAHENMCHTFRE